MRILLTNDDGIDAPGLALLERTVRTFSDDIWVVAPADNQSSCSRAITQTKAVPCEPRGKRRFAIGGTPGDCIIIGLNGLIENKTPDLVLSGVNCGSNLGEDIALSGTVGACLQAWEQGVPAIAFSQVLANFKARKINWCSAEAYLKNTLERLLPLLTTTPGVLNVNFPPVDDADEVAGITAAQPGQRLLPLMVSSALDESGQQWFDYRSLRNKKQVTDGSDIDLAYRGHITLTPLSPDLTDSGQLHIYTTQFNH